MLIRRHFLLVATPAAATLSLTACESGPAREQEARRIRGPLTYNAGEEAARIRELVRFATLAPSSQNTQCWKVRLDTKSIRLEADPLRRTPVVDPDDHHLFVSLGCAAENLVHAALANGLRAKPSFNPGGAGAIDVALEATKPVTSPLCQSITQRQCTRGDYDATGISTAELQLLQQAGTEPGDALCMMQ